MTNSFLLVLPERAFCNILSFGMCETLYDEGFIPWKPPAVILFKVQQFRITESECFSLMTRCSTAKED